ncbi:P pilus assembly/Cpx signaling pathway, periplasmic inhibitor/zinc-resistance associated protein [Anabaena sphaerica FACHB-251]|uniref:P pilus assembly/Cpx signaling pathway, periplasmic inhibitor/zinc-resistance associated protein n=1 Tax=Anabaena sphaerica FACHB-251 TaxID=2692883 RepID=A0A926WK55_9NOST|nr:Spy/CpxP family protein refolding chaperone [Anabaena sphaerica]MBD2296073.1 P pilus assembly/Cpx signaling pathway, periplasmic inhibitor/zinc-resistance associated protein [Anabaena sphaerica FACHB-251]
MKSKTLSFIAAAFALTLTATPFVAQAQETTPSPQAGKEFAKKGPWKKLGLSDAQKARMQEIRSNTRAEIDKVLTTAQKEQLKAAMQEIQNQRSQGEGRGRGKKDIFASLNLTEAQKTRMREIKESSKQQMEAVLTPAQREQMKQMQQNWKSRRQQGSNNSL